MRLRACSAIAGHGEDVLSWVGRPTYSEIESCSCAPVFLQMMTVPSLWFSKLEE